MTGIERKVKSITAPDLFAPKPKSKQPGGPDVTNPEWVATRLIEVVGEIREAHEALSAATYEWEAAQAEKAKDLYVGNAKITAARVKALVDSSTTLQRGKVLDAKAEIEAVTAEHRALVAMLGARR